MDESFMKQKALQLVMVLLFFCGLGVFLYPKATEWYGNYQTEKTIEVFEESIIQTEVEESIKEQTKTEIKTEIKTPEYERLYADMTEYNDNLYRQGQKGLKDPFSYENPSFNLEEYGFENNVIGTIEIEKIEVKLPLYLGATTENMKKGGGILGETSMPVGGENTNVVIAAHRGYKGIPMFREIEKIEAGDKLKITTVFETLCYQVTECKVILPDQISEILIQEGEDMVTLLTCHPYTQNTHRYLVFAKRCKEEVQESAGEAKTKNRVDKSKQTEEAQETAEKEEVDEEEVSERQIRLETYLPMVGAGVIILMIVSGIVLTRKRK